MKTKAPVLVALLMVFGLFAFVPKSLFQQKPWPVPEADKNKVNPLKNDATAAAAGKTLWDQHCKSCHGSKGKGDGPKASQLDTDPGDFSKPAFKNQTDGELFYKTTVGRKDMPAYKTKIPDANDRWKLVNYMRSL